jgi:DNA-directed RNA polymerase
MKEYSAWQYLLIDVANNNGLDTDKEVFEARIAWTEARLSSLEDFAKDKKWKQRPLYLKAVQAIRKAQKSIPIGHAVGLDAVCSGLQLMSVLSGCVLGAKATGLIDPDRRADAYTECSTVMSNILGYHIPNERSRVKQAFR